MLGKTKWTRDFINEEIVAVLKLAPLRGVDGASGGDNGGGGGGGARPRHDEALTMRKIDNGNQVRPATRPVSWCIGLGTGGLPSGPPPSPPGNGPPIPRSDLARRGLARSSSYQALHTALARLYRIDDFHKERIGAGFFSEVFKVINWLFLAVMRFSVIKVFQGRQDVFKVTKKCFKKISKFFQAWFSKQFQNN